MHTQMNRSEETPMHVEYWEVQTSVPTGHFELSKSNFVHSCIQNWFWVTYWCMYSAVNQSSESALELACLLWLLSPVHNFWNWSYKSSRIMTLSCILSPLKTLFFATIIFDKWLPHIHVTHHSLELLVKNKRKFLPGSGDMPPLPPPENFESKTKVCAI